MSKYRDIYIKISGPLLDRFDIQIEVTPVTFNELTDKIQEEKSKIVQSRVLKS